MAMLVHLANEKFARKIAMNGIKGQKRWVRAEPDWLLLDKAVYCMPVLPNYFLSHQWSRELKRFRVNQLIGVYFKLDTDEEVIYGHFNHPHLKLTLGEAIHQFMAEPDPFGYEIIIPRSISSREIHSIRPVSAITGWRYFPRAKGRKPCGCPVCLRRGEYNARSIRKKFYKE